ncbi:sensor histidine kinase [Phytoactinopolyspora alkaliphila]|uniref:Oxygen sensor histidine kinase NreB n=1 Tax=Phytoactinopolyspora alkaliphila TaxID=1783498 RepID=A0A6N9YHQ7_9ACTN|nr:sensor histidine kinase [Phytoactinopolyspora alkaliphila]NED94591.1 sensor histidine kinase [Phytoactinopolyspora alkaliphila]
MSALEVAPASDRSDAALGPRPDPADHSALFPSDARWRRPRPAPQQLRHDVWLAAAVVVGAVFATVLVNSMGAYIFDGAPSYAEQLAWGVGLTAPLAVRRRFPATVVVVVGAMFIASQVRENGDNLVPSIALFLAIYSLGAWGQDRVVARWVRIGVIVAMFAWLGISMAMSISGSTPEFPDAMGPLDPILAAALHGVVFNLLYFLSAYFFGNLAWESARRKHELEVQAGRLRRFQEENAKQAVISERVRIARDLHDVVAHHVSVMGVQAAAARRVFDVNPALANRSLESVEQTARTAISELRGLLGVLRADGVDHAGPSGSAGGAGHPSAPGLSQLPALVEETRSTGLQVNFAVFGDARAVPDAVALSAYRVVQEALTNTVKHAGATTADVRVRFLERALEVEVTDDGRGLRSAGKKAEGTGLGLVGMRERVAVHGGDLEATPRAGEGFRVRARFPLVGEQLEDAPSGQVAE